MHIRIIEYVLQTVPKTPTVHALRALKEHVYPIDDVAVRVSVMVNKSMTLPY